MRWSKPLSFLLSTLAVAILFTMHWIKQTFGEVTYEQIVWHILNVDTLQGFDHNYLRNALTHLVKIIIYSFIIGIFIKYIDITLNKLFGYSQRKIQTFTILASSILFIYSAVSFVIRYIDTNIISYNEKDFIAENYYIPENIVFNKKNNIIIVLAESLENSFGADFHETSYIERLEKVRDAAVHTPHMVQVYGTGWTIAAVTAWHFGLPLKTPHNIDGNRYISRSGFLPHATSIFDILHENGYTLKLLLGSDKHFSGKHILFPGHGKFEIQDKAYFLSKGNELEAHQGTEWGYRDAFLFDRAVEEYLRLKQKGIPFVLFIETVDTHSPNGFYPEENKKFFDIRDAIIELDRNIDKFFKKIKQYDTNQEDIVIILGDHYFMGIPDFMKTVQQRYIYNMFYGPVPILPEQKKNAVISALDIAPTLLQCAGARWENGRFGLGVSFFSEEPSLVEQYGLEKLNDLLSNTSKKYESFY